MSEQFAFLERMNRWPQQHQAQDMGCTCKWWGGGAILQFDRACPILHTHKDVPWDLNQLRLL